MFDMHIWKKMNYSLSYSLGLPFSLLTWTIDMAFVTLETSKFGPWKISLGVDGFLQKFEQKNIFTPPPVLIRVKSFPLM